MFQGSSGDEYLSVEASHNRAVSEANRSSPTTPDPSPTRGSPTLGSKSPLSCDGSREGDGKDANKQKGDDKSGHTGLEQSPGGSQKTAPGNVKDLFV